MNSVLGFQSLLTVTSENVVSIYGNLKKLYCTLYATCLALQEGESISCFPLRGLATAGGSKITALYSWNFVAVYCTWFYEYLPISGQRFEPGV
jgi:hypothetical protein